MEKIKSYIGFAKASKKIAFGQNTIEKTKHVCLIVCSNVLSDNTQDKLKTICPNMVVLDEQTYTMLNLSAKAFAIADKSLADAVQSELEKIGGK